MVAAGWSPSVRLFEAASCGVPIISDAWDGLDELFRPGDEILLAEGAEDGSGSPRPAGTAAARSRRRRARVLAAHTSAVRAQELEAHLREAALRLAGSRRAAGGLTCSTRCPRPNLSRFAGACPARAPRSWGAGPCSAF